MRRVVLFFFTWLVFINIFAVVANNRLNLAPDTAYTWINPQYTFQKQEWNVVDLHSKWDSYWYLDIVKHGYQVGDKGQLSNLVFFPLYPLFVKTIGVVLNNNYVLAGWLISNLFTFLSTIYLYKIVKEFHPKSDAFTTVLMLLVFPTAFFLNAIYTESTFLFFSVSSFYYTLKKNYLAAGILGFFASLTRLTGILLFAPLLVEYFIANRKKLVTPRVLPLLLIPLGTAVFFLYHYVRFHDLFIFFKVESLWGRNPHLSFNAISFATYPAIINFSLDIFFLLLAIVGTFFVSTKLRLSYGIYMLSSILVVLSSGSVMGMGRYLLVLFPIFILGGSIKNKDYSQIWILGSTLLMALYTLLFVTHYWAG